MKYTVHAEGKFQFIDEGKGETLLLLHGLFGALSNWDGIIECFSDRYRVIIPLLPIYELPPREAGLDALLAFLEEFVIFKNLTNVTVLGNSLGGHIGLLYTLKNQENVTRLVLTGSSGLFENSMGGSFPKRGSYEYIRERVAYTFYDPEVATKDLIDEVFETTSSIPKCMSIVGIAKSAQRHNLAKDLHKIKVPTLLVWGLNDTITPPHVGYEFNRLIAGSELHFIDKCCHAPMMEHPGKFNVIVESFLEKHASVPVE
ncbi:alpha/beta fold hydrolase [Dyadobacter sp. CY356]|uniref:alpha/beta fold hydrolase n=1 Tax=Dyadobacter sp. CY356 TaxID=2906442 RepID=UPI001F36FF23|nr:alpha/beta hydrolase [Dyadobacter sp. CY356]MCF0059391.1 alpha/beta hydrolase [Dyadobacter sp. CY356]